jgi:hypothetical protein
MRLRPGAAVALGTVVAISRAGALIETVQRGRLPAIAETLQLHIDAPVLPIDIEARVVSVGDASFSVEFADEPVELLELLSSLGG